MLQFVDPDLEWTYLDPADEDPQPQVCHGRHELETALNDLLNSGLRSYIEEVCALRATESWRWYVHQGSTDIGRKRPTTATTTP
jgi:hypothetical protein